jgi:dihydrofolate reductase
MRKIILSMMISLDGFIEDDDKRIDWHVWDNEMSEYMIGFFNRVDTILFGRITYQMMAEFWPTPMSDTEDSAIADRMNRIPKIVFSTTLDNARWGDWDNVALVKNNIKEEMTAIKQMPGKDLVLFGGANLAASFFREGLIDELQVIVNPVILGSGTPLFQEIKNPLKLDLIEFQSMGCGNVISNYKLIKNRKDYIR